MSFIPHVVRPRADVEIAIDTETAQAALELELTILRVRQPHDGAAMSLLGTPWPAWFVPQLAALQASSFSTKYLWFLSQLDALPSASIAKLSVHRGKLLDGSMRLLEQLPLQQLCAQTRIELIGEIGVDAGGLQREWYTMLTQAILDESAGLFVATDNYKYTIAPHSSVRPARYRCVGRLLGRALLDGQVLPFHLCTPMYKLLLGLPLSLLDVQFMDQQLYKSLLYVQTTPDVAALCLDFTVAMDAQHVVPLVPGGETMAVTVDNQALYVQVMTEYILFGRIQRQVEHFLAGFFEVLPPEWLAPFDYKELELLLCGIADISVDDWKQYTSVSAVFTTTDAIVLSWFWDAVANMTNTERAKLLQFATGSTHVPVQGFKGLTSTDGRLCPFSIKAIEYEPGMLPRSHACFNRIDLPVYPSRDELNAALQLLLQMDMTEFALV
ncbi:hypothetical protein SPRG_12807 [Saprolegnia parasitica CBS 223.65]|uniref:HECT-type E3 ubiquitin transferase n=1 Tax=Saprolegnia parasitica (strain CBS 223.65) TaxID=695850 RepID=A0A067C725_SAPPC|nr:hypothetical protein SPRG_12807 [Saprolegnia parasitica CBS 223.65]KDO22346.1 hypothetical protein SPRG_12807 [Saprolegnia parasitica CBS 223.65]|eukprot:XP_012206980.1 hypothetical protein SPRG_12807 [Saprolegnia parasitica CBS 223.65]